MNEKKIILTTTVLIAIVLIVGITIIKVSPKVEDELVDGVYTKIYSPVDEEYIFVEPIGLMFYDEDDEYLIKEAFEKKIISIERLRNRSTSSMHANDGGSVFYYFENTKLASEDFIICACKNANGNSNTYIILDKEGDFRSPCV